MFKIDPIYWFLNKIVLRKFNGSNISRNESTFIHKNITKHHAVLWINLFATFFIILGLRTIDVDKIGALAVALLGPVAVLGTAWFSVSFGGIPAKLLDVAMEVTFWMFTSFVVSLTTMFLSLAVISPLYLAPVLLLIYLSVIISAIQYDTADCLKSGLDDALLKHSRVALRYYERQGISENFDEKNDN